MLNRQWLEVLWAAVDCLKTAFIQTPTQHLNANLSVPNQVHTFKQQQSIKKKVYTPEKQETDNVIILKFEIETNPTSNLNMF